MRVPLREQTLPTLSGRRIIPIIARYFHRCNVAPSFNRLSHLGRFTAGAALIALVCLTGCGGGGSTKTTTPIPDNPNPTPGISAIAGRVTDIEGAPVVGATVSVNGLSATTTQFGTYRIDGVTVPSGETSVIVDINASKTINGVAWSGQNSADVQRGNATTNNIQLFISPTGQQGAITGTVRNSDGNLLSGASVYLSQVVSAGTDPAFTNLSASLQVTANDGTYRFPTLPPGSRYKLVAQYPGRTNSAVNAVTVRTAQTTTQSFILSRPSSSAILPSPDAFQIISLTFPAEATRAANSGASSSSTQQNRGSEALRHWILQQKGLLKKNTGNESKVFIRTVSRSRAAADLLIENVLSWQYREYNNLYGYRILRSVAVDNNFFNYATVQDPLAERFTDTASDLEVGVRYYYNLVRLDTVNFPANGTEGELTADNTLVTIPLGKLNLVAPAEGATTTSVPTFSWNAVGRGFTYQVLVYDVFPDLQSDTDIDGVRPISKGQRNAGANTGVLSLNYGQTDGTAGTTPPALVSGRRYYYAVIAQDEFGSAYSVSPIHSFIVQ